MNITVYEIKTVSDTMIYTGLVQIGDDKFSLTSLTRQGLETEIEKYFVEYTIDFKGQVTAIDFKRSFSQFWDAGNIATLDVMKDYYNAMLEETTKHVEEYQQHEDNISEYWLICEGLQHESHIVKRLKDILYEWDIVASDEQIDDMLGDIEDIAKIIYVDNMSSSDNYITGMSLGEVHEQIYYLPEYMWEKLGDDHCLTGSDNLVVNMGHDHIDIVLDIDMVKNYLYPTWYDSIVDNAKYDTFDHVLYDDETIFHIIRLHNYELATMIELKYGDKLPDDWKA